MLLFDKNKNYEEWLNELHKNNLFVRNNYISDYSSEYAE